MNWEERPITLAFVAGLTVGSLGYGLIVLAVALHRIVPLWVFGALFGLTFLMVLIVEILTAATAREEPPADE